MPQLNSAITSTSNPRVKEARKLQERRHRQASGRLLLEGVRLVGDALQSGAVAEQVFYVAESLQAHPVGQQLLAQLQAAGVECLACTPAVFASLAETVTPQGLAAIVFLPQLIPPAELTFTLILDGVRDPGNAGTLLRSAEAAGVELVLFGPQTVDPYNDKVVRAGMGAHFRLPLRTCPDSGGRPAMACACAAHLSGRRARQHAL